MKHSKILFVFMVALTTMLSWWTVPSLVKKMTDSANPYPLMYYSARLKEICIIDFRKDSNKFYDIKGNEYPRAQYDSLLPMLNFRQLMMNGTLPDTLEGQAIDPKLMRPKQVVFRYYPKDMHAPQAPMGTLLEAMPKRMNLTLPGDYFRMDDAITFVDAETNEVKVSKSQKFTEELKRKGFAFPVQHYWGNPTTRKAYEEGYFCLDSKGALYHLKMVNGRPFVKDTGIGSQVDISWFSMLEVPDKRFYGFLFGKDGSIGIMESTEEGGYHFLPMDTRAFNPAKDELMVMGNMLFWTVRITDENGTDCYGMDAQTLKTLSSYHMDRKETLWDQLSDWLFLCQLTPESKTNAYVSIYLSDFSFKALFLNVVILVLFMVGTMKKRLPLHTKGGLALYLLIAGLPGLLVLAFLPPCEEN